MSELKEPEAQPGELYFDIFLLLASVFLLVVAYRISGISVSGPGTFPLLSTAVMVGALLSALWKNRHRKRKSTDGFLPECRQLFAKVVTLRFLVYAFICIAYVVAIQPLHFLPSSFIFLVISIIYLKGARPVKAIAVSAAMLVFVYVVFLFFFKVLLP